MWPLLLLLSAAWCGADPPGYHESHTGRELGELLDEWTVELEGGEEMAQLVALQLGYEYGGQVLGFPNIYTFRLPEGSKSRRTGTKLPFTIKDNRIKWSERQFTKSRVKRQAEPDPDKKIERVKRIEESIRRLETSRDVRMIRQRQLYNDELWGLQWYMQDTRSYHHLPHLDLNVLPVYAKSITGKGVRVCVVDDGIEYNHTDLYDNYDPEISWDCVDGDPDPYPIVKDDHGTRCAGEIAMTANNKKCGVGVAWRAKVGGVRMFSKQASDREEGEALGYAFDKVDIYSCSWGPNDDGRHVEGPGRLALEAIRRAIRMGRGGKGAIYVWANGNGGKAGDNCNCDGYSSSIYTISIGSASGEGKFPWYGEMCSSTLATAYSAGSRKDAKIVTTDVHDACTLNHSGTSAAAPLAAGIVALALEANPELTWRDVQHLIVWTSEYAPLASNPGWQINGVGLRFNVRFGFGLLNAAALVDAAFNWTTVPAKRTCTITTSTHSNVHFKSQDNIEIFINLEDCAVKYIEHVELVVNISYKRRGALEVYLTSPQGTEVQLLGPRSNDTSPNGFMGWPLTSVATWGEDPIGIWKVHIKDETNEDNNGILGPFTLFVHGTPDMPNHMQNGPRIYHLYYNNMYNDYNNEILSEIKTLADIFDMQTLQE